MYRWSIGTLLLCAMSAVSTAPFPDDKKPQQKIPPAVAFLLKSTPEEFIKRFDKNKDGYLTKDELPPALANQFEKLDTNGDGRLDRQEVERMFVVFRQRFAQADKAKAKTFDSAAVERGVEDILRRLDTNKDGKISNEEAKGKPLEKAFERFDTNKDGYLDKEELRAIVEQRLRQANRNPQAGKRGPPQANPANAVDFDSLDKNADGRLTREELRATRFAKDFEMIDANKDGKIDRKEFAAYLKKLDKLAEEKKAEEKKAAEKKIEEKKAEEKKPQ
jgi:Ca2+-binding EF-hand superfamily protein